ncbi:MAG: dihydroorotate dehydrogenase [Anaerolineae bacterium CG2_30_64_16]|nr:MAG: dihydroorotate dehydrogenase [Anaerolineae bacterium CG2_30_64_16]
MTDLTTHYMGLSLKNPIVPSASPLSKKVSGIRQMEDAGAAAVVMYSLFEEQIDMEALAQHHFIEQATFVSAEATAYFPKAADYNRGPDGYLELIRAAKAAVDIPIIGSLNGVTPGGWTRYARLIEEAGADALELNVYLIPTRTDVAGPEIEQVYLDVLRQVKASVSVPVAMKLSPFFSALPHMAQRLDAAGADALVLFNRFYQPDFDLEELTVTPNLVLSRSEEMRLPLRWIAILYGHVKASLALTTGIHTPEDVLKAMMAGADVANVASVLLTEGPGKITELIQGVSAWMEAREYNSIHMMQGSLSQRSTAEPAAFERANYMKVLGSWR